jgi:type VI secretion system secreted protein Hcp
MAVDAFLKLDPIKGESTDAKHKDEIEILTFSFGVSQTGSFQVGTGGGTGKANFQDLSFTHYVDKASCDLFQASTMGKHLGKGVLTVRKAGGKDALEYLKVTMEDIIVSSVQYSGQGAGDEHPVEHVSLNFRKFKQEYTAQTEKGGAGTTAQFKWDIAANTE